MKNKLKIYKCDFPATWPVGCCLVLAAYDKPEAEKIARETIRHTDDIVVNEMELQNPQVIVYLSGDY